MMLAERLHGRPIPIPAPPYRMRRGSSGRQSFQAYSNPRTPYRMRPRGVARDRHGGRIPIPTSLRDATRPRPPPATTSTHSNPHIPTGCDVANRRGDFAIHLRFQSPHPYGMRLRAYRVDGRRQIPIPASLRDATPRCGPLRAATPHSNPHIPTGCDSTPFPAGTCTPIPIPASLRDATVAVSERRRQPDDSNPHIPTGCDKAHQLAVTLAIIPIPTSLRDATEGGHAPRRIKGIPIPTSLRDATATIIA